MKAFLLGLIFLAAAFFTGFCWWGDVLVFLKGAVPVIALFIGLVAVFIGIADLKDKAAAKKEEAKNQKA
jgi:ABC-type multidrug transport system permease subunit